MISKVTYYRTNDSTIWPSYKRAQEHINSVLGEYISTFLREHVPNLGHQLNFNITNALIADKDEFYQMLHRLLQPTTTECQPDNQSLKEDA